MHSGEMSDSALSSLCVLRQCSTMTDLDNRPMIVFATCVLTPCGTLPHHVGTHPLRRSMSGQDLAKEERLPDSSIRAQCQLCPYRNRQPGVRARLDATVPKEPNLLLQGTES